MSWASFLTIDKLIVAWDVTSDSRLLRQVRLGGAKEDSPATILDSLAYAAGYCVVLPMTGV